MSAPFYCAAGDYCDAGIIAILARWAEAGTRNRAPARYFRGRPPSVPSGLHRRWDATALAAKESWKQLFGRLPSAPRLDGVHGRVEGEAQGAQHRQRHHGGAMHTRCTMDEDSV